MRRTELAVASGVLALAAVAYVRAACYVSANDLCCTIVSLPSCVNPCSSGQPPCCPLTHYSEPITGYATPGNGVWGKTALKASGTLCKCEYYPRVCVNGHCEIQGLIPPSTDPLTLWGHPQIPDPNAAGCQGQPGGGGGPF